MKTSLKLAISMTAWKRPELTKRVLDTLPKDVPLYAGIEPGNTETQELIFKHHSLGAVMLNSERLGITENTRQAMSAAFSDQADFVIHVEDDVILMPTALDFIRWAAAEFKNDQTIGTTSCHSLNHFKDPGAVAIQRWFGCYSWGTWRDRFESMQSSWCGDERAYTRSIAGWQLRCSKRQIYPIASLSMNIGWGSKDGMNSNNYAAPMQYCYESTEIPKYRVEHVPVGPNPWWSDVYPSPPDCMLALSWLREDKIQGWEIFGDYDGPWLMAEQDPIVNAPVLFMTESNPAWLDLRLQITPVQRVILTRADDATRKVLSKHSFWCKHRAGNVERWCSPFEK